MMKIAYLTQYNPKDIHRWSGSVYYIAKSLEAQDNSIQNIGSLTERFGLLYKAKHLVYQKVIRKSYLRTRAIGILKGYAHQASHYLSKVSSDVVFSPSTLPMAYLDCKEPIVFWTDASFAGMVNFYPKFINLCDESLSAGHLIEQSALDRCRLALYSSDWAARTAVESYQVDPSKVRVVPFGANLECDRTLDDIKNVLKSRTDGCCKLLFLGVDWHRKGGAIALGVAEELNQRGLPTKLTIVGCQPDIDKPLPDFVTSLGFISKASPQGLKIINQLLSESHFLILPSQAECYGIVFCEANSFGLPCLTTNVGGIPTVIRDDLNGKTFSINASIAEYCQFIEQLFSNYSAYRELAISSFHEYESRLNWSVAGKTVQRMLREL